MPVSLTAGIRPATTGRIAAGLAVGWIAAAVLRAVAGVHLPAIATVSVRHGGFARRRGALLRHPVQFRWGS